MRTLSIDIETYSSAALPTSGVYKYTESRDFEVLLFAYSIDSAPVEIIDLAQGEEIPQEVLDALEDNSVIKYAFNAQFERVSMSRFLYGRKPQWLDPTGWRCTMIWAATLGLPGSLDGVSTVLGLAEEKMKAGKSLITYFSVPCKPTKVNGGRTRNLPFHDPEKWELFKKYCVQDVVVEMEIQKKLSTFPVIPQEWKLYAVDQAINDNGVLVDTNMINNIISYNETYTEELMEEAHKITGLSNPNSLTQLKKWFNDNGVAVDSLVKKKVEELLSSGSLSKEQERILQIRQELGMTSVKKYETMQRAKCLDDRIRGTLQFYGANRTGRWAGRLIQVQNLPQNKGDFELYRELVIENNMEMLDVFSPTIPYAFKQLIRTAIIAGKGKKFVVSDFSAIEARVIAWLAGETWRQEVFATHGKIYEASASQMFKIPIDEVDKELRQKGKIAELALGYGGGAGALKQMGAVDMGIEEKELQGLVDAWRAANTKITKLWQKMNFAALKAIKNKTTVKTEYGITFSLKRGFMFIDLPSGRSLSYAKAHLTENRFGSESIGYWGVDQTKRTWCQQETYGGKLVENIVQAIARDILADTIVKVYDQKQKIVMHVHDEVVLEVKEKDATAVESWLENLMSQEVEWAEGLKLGSEAFIADYYQK